MLVKEVISLAVDIFITLGIKIMEKGKKDLGLRVLVTNVVKKDIELLNVLIMVKRLEEVVEMSCLVKKLFKHLINLRMIRI